MSLAAVKAGLSELREQLDRIEAPPDLTILERRNQLIYSQYADDPEGFVSEVLGEDDTPEDVVSGRAQAANAPWEKQTEIMLSVRDHRRTSVRACHSVGKTHIAARVACWFLYTRAPAIVITTAPKATQVRDLLWGRFRAAWGQARLPLHGECLLTRCTPNPGDSEWYAVGYTARDADAFQGYHEAWVLIIFDEAPGVPPFIYDAAEGMMSGINVRMLLIGNPVIRSGPYYRSFRSPLWNNIHISAYEHPNVILKQPIYPKAVAPEWPEERREEWGEDHPLYQSRVKGEFPDEAEDTLIPLPWVEAAINREVETKGDKILGVDVARFGLDETVLILGVGGMFSILEKYTGKDTTHTANRIVNWIVTVDRVGIDDSGVGGGVTDQCKDKLKKRPAQRVKIVPLNAGEKAKHSDDFENLGSEMWWALRLDFEETYDAVNSGVDDPKVGISIPNDQELVDQLTSRLYDVTVKGRIKVESKKDMISRGEKSPDRADALVQANWLRTYKPPQAAMERVY